ncbi:MAG TPA: tetratricopeptide repeat protein, partial [Nitrososphaerales archaeon]|nr:tetratricopeptide repeat protein [Nitrososphaerales archaeon]
NMSPDPADEYFADGMTEELITTLSGVKSLTVIARTSVMRYKNVARPISEIGRELNSGSLIEGSVRKAMGKVRITVQLIDARNEGHLWAQAYDRQLDDIFGIQSEIAEKVVKELRAQLVESEKQRIEKRPTTSTEAYTLYLKARHYWNERSKEGLGSAIEYFARAIEIDSSFAMGYSGLADCYSIIAHNSLGEIVPNYEKAKEYASKALELDGGLAEAHAGLAIILTDYERDWKSAESEFKKAIELKPNYSSAHQWYAISLAGQGRLDEATKQIKTALALDPFSLIINVNVGDSFYYNGQFEEAIAQFEKVVEMDPNFPPVYPSLTQAYVHVKMFDEALQAADKYGTLTKRPSWIKLARGYVFSAMGKREQAIKMLKEAEQEGYKSENLSPCQFAQAFFLMGDNEQGFSWLERAYEEHDGILANMKIDFEFEKLRDDPRYLAMLKKLGLNPLSVE